MLKKFKGESNIIQIEGDMLKFLEVEGTPVCAFRLEKAISDLSVYIS